MGRYAHIATRQPPLGAWLVAVFLSLALTAALLGAFRPGFEDSPAVRAFRARYAALKEHWPSDSALTVVVLGASLTQEGIEGPAFFRERSGGKPLFVQKIWYSGASLELLAGRLGLLDSLVSLRPDVVCIDESLLAFRHPRDTRPWLTWLADVSRQLHQILLPAGWRDRGRLESADGPTFDQFNPRHGEVFAGDSTRIPAVNYEAREYGQDRFLQDGLARLQESGSQLVLLHIPRSPALDRRLHSGEREEAFRQLRDYYTATFGFQYWSPERTFSFVHYRDYVHFNQSGSRRYSDWLAERLVAYGREEGVWNY